MSLDPQTTEIAKESALALLGINWKIFIAQLVNFLIVVLILWRFVWRPLVKLMSEREEKISTSLKQAQEIEARLTSAVEEQKTIVKGAHVAADLAMQEARKKAEKLHQEELSKTQETVGKMIEQAKKEISRNEEASRESLRHETLELVAAVAEKIIAEKIDSKKDHELIAETIRSLKKNV